MRSDNYTREQCEALVKHAELECNEGARSYWQGRIDRGEYRNA